MAQITWLGEDTTDVPGPSFTTCFGRKFHKGQPVEVTDADTIRRAQGNPYFSVDGIEAADDEDDDGAQNDPTKGMNIDALRAKAAELDIPHEGVKKADLRAAIREKLAA